MNRSALTRIETTSKNVYLDQLWPLLVALDMHPETLLTGEGDKPWSDDLPTLEALDYWVRKAIRALRGTEGTPAVAATAWDGQWCSSTIVRWESGEYQRIDIHRLHLLAEHYGSSLLALLVNPEREYNTTRS